MVVERGPLQDLLRQLGRERPPVPDQRRHGREPRRAGVRRDQGLDPAQAQHDGQGTIHKRCYANFSHCHCPNHATYQYLQVGYLHGVEHDLGGLEAHELPAGGEDGAGDEHPEEQEALQQEGAEGVVALHGLVQPLPGVLVVALLHLLQQRQQARHQAPLQIKERHRAFKFGNT